MSTLDDGSSLEHLSAAARHVLNIDADSGGTRADYAGLSAVGFAEIAIPGVQATERVRLPVDLNDALTARNYEGDLAVVLTRLRSNTSTSFAKSISERLSRSIL